MAMDYEQYCHPARELVSQSKTMSPSHATQPAAEQSHSVDCEIDLSVDSSFIVHMKKKTSQEHD